MSSYDTLSSSAIADALRCPICTDFPEDEVFQCKNGHVICKRCSEKVVQCPECRVDYETGGLTRNRVMEDLLQTVEVDCPRKDSGAGFGCGEKVKLKDVGGHLKTCSLSKYQNNKNLIRICKLLGFSSCEFFIDMTSEDTQHQDTQKVRDHFLEKHHAVMKFGRSVSVNFANLRDRIGRAAQGAGTIWSPIIITVDKSSEGPTLLICASLHPDDSNNLSWICILIGGDHKAGENSAEGVKLKCDLQIQMSGPSPLPEDVYWTFPALRLSQDLWFKIKARLFRTPVDFLAQFIPRHNDFLQLKLGIIQDVPERPMSLNISTDAGLEDIFWSFDTDMTATSSSLAVRAPTPGPGQQSSSSSAAVSVGNRSRRGATDSGSPSESYSDESDTDSEDEECWTCVRCGRFLLEYPRFACLQCLGDSIFMCERCYNEDDFGIHKEHVFVLIDNDAKMKRTHRNADAFTLAPRPPVMPDICKSENLPRCHHPCHRGNNSAPFTHYVCIECNEEPCRFCSNCFYRDRINGVHNSVHVLAVTDTDERAELIEYIFYRGELPKQ